MKRISSLLLAFSLFGASFAQNNNEILIRVGDETVTKSEFINAYQKNNLISQATEQDLREYLELYINYRMKVQEAAAMQMDTSEAFKKELASYANQSAQPYLMDSEVNDQLLEEAFEHSKYHVRASHILVRCNPLALPKDTMSAYHKIKQIREKIVNGMDFNEAAVVYSEDESAQDRVNPQTNRMQYGNRGELGYFSVLEMIYPFEVAAYDLPIGKVSDIIRTQYGYHLVYVQDKIPAISNIYVSQIFIADTNALKGEPDATVKTKLKTIAEEYKRGVSFSALAMEYSDDKATREHGGRMTAFSPNRRPGNYVSAAVHLKAGEISEPVPTNLGWHILQLDSIQYVITNDETKAMLKSKLQRDSRSRKSKSTLLERLKIEYNFAESGKKAAMKFFKKNVPATYFQSTNIVLDSLDGITKLKPMFTFADQQGTAVEFSKLISRYQGVQLKSTPMEFINNLYLNFVGEKIMQYEKSRLTEKYPEYRELTKEFHDGMMLYEINSEKVWNAAIKDSVGLAVFYESIKTEYPVETPDDTLQYKPLSDIRAIIVARYQDKLEKEWTNELRAKYPVFVDEKVFKTILNQ